MTFCYPGQELEPAIAEPQHTFGERGIDGELYICDRAIFERSYDFKTAGT